jgi:hypothetical protein
MAEGATASADRHWETALDLIERGDAEGVADYLLRLSEAERSAIASRLPGVGRRAMREMTERAWMELAATGQAAFGSIALDAAATAALACASYEQLQRPFTRPPVQLAIRILTVRRPPWANRWLERWCETQFDGGCSFELLDALVAARVATITPALALALPPTLTDHAPEEVPLDVLIEERPWLQDAIWLLFEHEGGGAPTLAANAQYSHTRKTRSLAAAFVLCAERGVLDRDRLLDASLDALAQGFAAFRARWFQRFHELLAPTPIDRARRCDRYVALLASQNGGTVTLALDALDAIARAGALPAGEIARALQSAPELPTARSRARAAALTRRLERAG